MKIDFDLVNQLEKTEIESGSRWVYVADFNIKHTGTKLKSTQRIDVEVEDLKQLQEGGARVVILAHEGRFNDGPGELDFVVSYLSEQLGVDVKYFKENDTFAARNFAKGLQSGDVAIMGNTRKNEGEENGDDSLAQRFSKLGKSVAIGGFGKAHRVNSSNIGILKYLPGYATQSQLREMRNLEGLAGREEGISSVAVLGGIKKEKITIGLVGLIDSYDVVIPGGIVLNTCLVKKFNFDVGDSVVEDSGKTFYEEVRQVLRSSNGKKILLPEIVIVGKNTDTGYKDIHPVRIRRNASLEKGYQIVSYVMPDDAAAALDYVVKSKGRILVAGTLDLFSQGIGIATAEVIQRLKQPGVNGAVLGGDTAAEINYNGIVSTGGGSALYFVANGTTPVFEALMSNKAKFSKL